MLQSFLLILIALLIGFAFMVVAVLGRVGAGTSLPPARRWSMALVGVLAWSLAAYWYLGARRDRPVDTPAPAVASISNVDTRRAEQEREEAALAPALGEAQYGPTAPAPTPPIPGSEDAAVAEPTNTGTSAAALELEQEMAARRPMSDAPAPLPVAPAPVVAPVAAVAPPPAFSAKALERPTAAPVTTAPVVAQAAAPRRAAPARAPKVAAASKDYSGGLHIAVLNELGDDQSHEQLSLFIEGREVASLNVDRQHPRHMSKVQLPRPGFLNYQLVGTSYEGGVQSLRGRGCIEMLPGSRFEVARGDNGPYLIALRD